MSDEIEKKKGEQEDEEKCSIRPVSLEYLHAHGASLAQ